MCCSWEAQLTEKWCALEELWEQYHQDREWLWESAMQEWQELEWLRRELASLEQECDLHVCLAVAVKAALLGHETVLVGREEVYRSLECQLAQKSRNVLEVEDQHMKDLLGTPVRGQLPGAGAAVQGCPALQADGPAAGPAYCTI